MTGVLLKLKFVISRTSEPGYYAVKCQCFQQLFWKAYMNICHHITVIWLNNIHVLNTNNHNSSICLREGIWAHETSLTPPLLIQEINEIVPSQDNEWLCIFFSRVAILSVSSICRLDLGTLLFGAPEFIPAFSTFRVAQSLVFCVVFCRSLFLFLSISIWSFHCLSFFDFTAFDCPFGIFKCFFTHWQM